VPLLCHGFGWDDGQLLCWSLSRLIAEAGENLSEGARVKILQIDWHLAKGLNNIHGREFSPRLRTHQVGSLDRVCRRPDFLKFCFVRNPYARLLSTYLDRIGNSKEQKIVLLRAMNLPADLNCSKKI